MEGSKRKGGRNEGRKKRQKIKKIGGKDRENAERRKERLKKNVIKIV